MRSHLERRESARRGCGRGDDVADRGGDRRGDRPAGPGRRATVRGDRDGGPGSRPGPRGPSPCVRSSTSHLSAADLPAPSAWPRPRRRAGDVRVEVELDVRAALATADVVCCATTAGAPLFPVDGPCRTASTSMRSGRSGLRCASRPTAAGSGLVVVDERAAVLEESGEILHAIATGALTADGLLELGVRADRGRRADSPYVVQVGRRGHAGLGGRGGGSPAVPRLIGTRRVDVG